MVGKLTEEEIEAVIAENNLGRIGCNDGNRTYIVPINYVYDGKSIIAHSLEGMKIAMMRKQPDICFTIDDIKTANEWKTVIAWGHYQELKEERDRYQAMKLFVDKMMHIKISETAAPPELNPEREHPAALKFSKPIIYRLILTERTGRFEKQSA